MPRLEPDLLKAFLAVAERGGFGAAADGLARSQSTVSMQIRRLEEAVGSPLFERTSHFVRLTREGEAMLGYARRLLALGEEAVQAVAGAAKPRPLRIGCIEDWATRLLPPALARLADAGPGLEIQVTTGATAELMGRLGIDHDLVIGMVPAGWDGRGVMLAGDRLVWAGSAAASALADRRPLPLALHPEGCLYRRWATRTLDDAGISWRLAYGSPGLGAVEAAVRAGLALSPVLRSTLAPGLREVEPGRLPALPAVGIVGVAARDAPQAAADLLTLLSSPR